MLSGQFRRAPIGSIVGLACACQGRPNGTKALRAGGSVGGSTVDKHSPDWGLVRLRIARRGFWPEAISGFDRSWLVDQLQHPGAMLELIARV